MEALFGLSKLARNSIIITLDVSISIFCTWLAFSVRYEKFYLNVHDKIYVFLIPIISFLIVFHVFKLYSNLNRFTGFNTIQSIIYANSINIILVSIIFIFFAFPDVPRSIGLLSTLFFSAYVIVSRIFISNVYNRYFVDFGKKRTVLFGESDKGIEALNALSNHPDYKILGYVGGDQSQRGNKINNINVYDEINLKKIINKKNISNVIFALPSYEITKKRDFINFLKNENIQVSYLPSISKILSGKITFSDIREIELKDIFSRSIEWDTKSIRSLLFQKIILITGAGGSIGSELSRQVITYDPEKIILLDNSEYNLFNIERELTAKFPKLNNKIIPVLADITDKVKIQYLFEEHKPNIVFHAAAYKHVDLVERNFNEAIKNNLFGTINLMNASLKSKVANFHFVSTDKAVKPKSYMGLTKRIAEIYLQSLSVKNKIKISIVRFGNVLGSSGSVVPLFKEQLKKGGPLTVTHKDAERYFMTIPEATGLILQSSSINNECAVYILDMGKPWKIIDLAKSMINLSGLKEKINGIGDIEIVYTGLKKGEKLKEDLINSLKPEKTQYKEIYMSRETFLSFDDLNAILNELEILISKNKCDEVIESAKRIIYLSDAYTVE